MGAVKDFFFGKPAGVKSPFATPQERAFETGLGDRINSLFGSPEISKAYGVNPLEAIASQGLLGTSPGSFFSGPSGAMGGRPTGSTDLLSQTLSGAFLDPKKNPFYSSLVSGSEDEASRFLNKAFDKIAASSAQAGGGVAASSARPQQETAAAKDVSTQLGTRLADIESEIYGKERGFQEQAIGQDINRLLSLANLGNIFQTRQEQGLQFPLDEALKYLGTIRGVPIGPSPSPFATLLQGIGSLGQGAGSLAQGGGLGAVFG